MEDRVKDTTHLAFSQSFRNFKIPLILYEYSPNFTPVKGQQNRTAVIENFY